MKMNLEKIVKHINRVDESEYYSKLLICSKKDLIRNIATFLFDHGDERKYLKKNLPADVYLKVIEALVDGDHDT